VVKKKDIASKEAKRKAATRKQIDTPGGGATFGEGTDCDGGVRQEQDAAGPVALIRGHERSNFKLIDVVAQPPPAAHPLEAPDPEAT
jgi:hypothetical protein